ncbi:MAG: hypothetical protein ACRD1J_00590, partial [Terriglobia bacterium]
MLAQSGTPLAYLFCNHDTGIASGVKKQRGSRVSIAGFGMVATVNRVLIDRGLVIRGKARGQFTGRIDCGYRLGPSICALTLPQ